MEFGKLSSLDNVAFNLPPDPPGNVLLFQKLKDAVNMHGLTVDTNAGTRRAKTLFIGATGWGMKEWVGKIYPLKAKSSDYLRHYTRQFNTIELNTTHYRIPDAFTVQHWYDEAAADFRFCPKVLQTISHARDLGLSNDLSSRFCEALSGLRDKLGPCFIQLPPYFGPSQLPVLEGFLKNFSLPLAVEVRHEGWFDKPLHFNNLRSLLEKYGVSTVITDVAGRRDVCHMQLTTDKVLVRFVGNNLHPTDYSRMDEWVDRLEDWFDSGVSEVYFFTHEPDNLLAPELAIYLFEKMKKKEGFKTRGPVIDHQEKTGQQMSLF
jgi:uncharacterized protein YecE (DUF72 family)